MNLKYIIVNKSEKIKSPEFEGIEIHQIDVNSWFKSNSLNPSEMNEIRQFIFEEWIIKKIQSTKNKILPGAHVVIIYDNPSPSFISFLEQKISLIFECESCELILIN